MRKEENDSEISNECNQNQQQKQEHEQFDATDSDFNSKKSLEIVIDIYNSELKYLNLLKNAIEIYGQPLR